MRRIASRLHLALLGVLLVGCSGAPTEPAKKVSALPVADPWKIVWTHPDPKDTAYLTNGVLGARIGADGSTVVSAWRLDAKGSGPDEVLIKPIEGPRQTSDPAALVAKDYSQTLDLRHGHLNTHFNGKDHGFDVPTPVAQSNERRQDRPYWDDFWKTDIKIDGPVEDQQAVRSFLFYVRSSVAPNSKFSVSPYGLSNPQYKGHVFWDADTWVFPALAFLDPVRAKGITDYRLGLMRPYEANAKGSGLRVPWESAVSGREVAPPADSEEIHVTGAAAFGLDMAASLGLEDSSRVADFCSKANRFYQSRATRAPDGVLELKHVGSVDESHTVDNDLFTNLLAQWLANGCSWNPGQVHYRIPTEGSIPITYSNDHDRSHKQAAAVLAVFPLQYPEAEAKAMAMLERYAPITIKQGPAMTDSVEATILARAGEVDRAYEQWEHSWADFVKPPHLLFSEHRATRETYFVTGAAGCLQTVLYGFLGFRIDSHKDAHAAWSTPLKQGKWLNVAPHLPKAWKKIQLKGLQVLGRSYTMTATPTSVTVIRGD